MDGARRNHRTVGEDVDAKVAGASGLETRLSTVPPMSNQTGVSVQFGSL
jgi:hypothetical protein